jgi:IS5 family transposase
MTRVAEPQISFADYQLREQGVFLDPALRTISDFLDQQQEILEKVRHDLQRGLKNPHTGRHGLTPSQVLRSLVLMRVKNWDYRELQERIADGYTLRSFTAFLSQPVPKHDAFNRAFNRLTPETLQEVNALVLQAAIDLELEDGKKLRVDTTVVQTNIHHPTDSTLLWDTVRVITRIVGQLHEQLPQGVQSFTNRTRSARRRMQAIQRMTARQREQQQTKKYRELIGITQQVVASGRQVLQQTRSAKGASLVADVTIKTLRQELEHYCQLGDQVIDQARRRVLEGEQVPTEEKIYSIFEPHTDLIKRGKQQTPVEFGHKVFLGESAQGFITQYEVLDGNPVDEDQVVRSLREHQDIFGHPPEWYAGDRGFYSDTSVRACEQDGVPVVSIPQRGGQKTPERKAYEKSSAFKKAQRFRAGIEGRISVLFRGRGMKRCLAHGPQRFELFVGAAVLANNLMRLAALLLEPSVRKRKAA